jgi:hypothetical protein
VIVKRSDDRVYEQFYSEPSSSADSVIRVKINANNFFLNAESSIIRGLQHTLSSIEITSLLLKKLVSINRCVKVKSKGVPLHAMDALRGRGGIAPTHSRPRH